MLTLEEYIARRKKEDRLNEFDLNSRLENIRICANYVFEYFNSYLDITEAEEKTALLDEKLEKFSKQLKDYDPEVRSWLVDIYKDHRKHMHRYIGNILKEYEFYFLYNSDSEFRSLSYDCYSKLIKKLPFLKDQTEMLFLFIKDHHRVRSQWAMNYVPDISVDINEWIENTWNKYHVNTKAFAVDWADRFYGDENSWPSTYRRKSQYSWRKYDYDIKQKSNLFNLDSLYRRMPKKLYTKGRKQEFEVLMMYYWLHSLEGDEDGYWQEYLEKVLLVLERDK